jgi:hypothetical protein
MLAVNGSIFSKATIRSEDAPVTRAKEMCSWPMSMHTNTVNTGIDGCRHVAIVTPANWRPRMYRSWLRKRHNPKDATAKRS